MDDDYGKNLIEKIINHLNANGIIIISTYTKATQYDKRHVDFFKIGSDGSPLVKRGKNWDNFRYANVNFYICKE
jgi:hypothetical protein